MIDVIWWNACRGNWDSGVLCSIFEKNPDVFKQYNEPRHPQELNLTRAIVIVAGRPDVGILRRYLDKLTSGIVILTSEEDSFFEWEAAIPEHLEVWTQYYSPNKHAIKERLLLGAPNRLKNYKINKHLPKKYLWSFIGQVQNPFRQACVDVLKTLPDGFLHTTLAFGGEVQGIEYQEYLDICCQSHYVICPAGSMCVDSFRLYEAIECGAIPITDVRAPRDPEDFNYWDEVYPSSKVITVKNWSDLNVLDMAGILPVATHRNYWWYTYKVELEKKLLNAANKN